MAAITVNAIAQRMEAVAARAHTGKQVLYRRWRNRAELVVAAMRHRTGSIVADVPDTGTLRGDVLAVLQRMADRFASLGARHHPRAAGGGAGSRSGGLLADDRGDGDDRAARGGTR